MLTLHLCYNNNVLKYSIFCIENKSKGNYPRFIIESKLDVSQHVTVAKCKISHMKQVVKSSYMEVFSQHLRAFVLLYS